MRTRLSGLPLVSVMMIVVGGLLQAGRHVQFRFPAPATPAPAATAPAPVSPPPARPTPPEAIKPAKPEEFVGLWQPVSPSQDRVAKVRKDADGYVLVPYPGQRIPLLYRDNRMIFVPCDNGPLERSPYLVFDRQTGQLLMKSGRGHTMASYTRQ